MHSLTLITCLLLASTTGWAQYTLQQDYMEGGNFLDQFTFWTAADPTDGFVQYVSQPEAEMGGMINQTSDQVTLAADSSETTTTGRKSIRITSNQSYQSGLVILDLAHMPGSICGTWPAFWMVGPDWPNQGEIDIIEGVNENTANSMTLHTGPGCSIDSSSSGGALSDVFSGNVATSNCDINAPNQATNAGCSIDATSSNTYGNGFNSAGGGVYAMELASSSISIWFFSRGSIPSDVSSNSPDPSGWGEPLSKFAGDCDFSQKFTNQQIVFDTTFCGQWAGAVWPSSSCAAQYGGSCENFVGQNPSAFAETFWTINSLKVFQGSSSGGGSGGGGSGQSSAGPTTFARSTRPGGFPGHGQPTGFPQPGGSPSGGGWGGQPQSSEQPSSPSAPSGGFGQPTSTPSQEPPSVPTQAGNPNPNPHSPQPPQGSPPTQARQSSPAQTQSQGGSGSGGEGNGNPHFHFHNHGGAASTSAATVEAMTASVSQNLVDDSTPTATAAATSTSTPAATTAATTAATSVNLAQEHSLSAGVYDVTYPTAGAAAYGKRSRHLRQHLGRHVH